MEHGIASWVVPISSGRTSYGTPSTTHSEICGQVLFAMVTAAEYVTVLASYMTLIMMIWNKALREMPY